MPDRPPPKAQRPDYDADVGAARPGERRARKRWDDEQELVAWVVRYLDELPRGERPSQRGYNAWARRTEGAPWSSRFDRFGGWSALLAAARRQDSVQ